MRLLLWVLLVTLVTLLTSVDGLSTTDADKKQVSQLDSGNAVAPRVLAANYEHNNEKRSLRVENEETEADTEDEERSGQIFVKFKGSLERLKERLRNGDPFSTANIEKRYQKLAEGGRTPDFYLKEYYGAAWQVRSWKERSYQKYLAWYTTKYDPSWVSKFQKKK